MNLKNRLGFRVKVALPFVITALALIIIVFFAVNTVRHLVTGTDLVGFYPVTADIPKKRHTVPKECSCPDAENIAQSSNAKPSP